MDFSSERDVSVLQAKISAFQYELEAKNQQIHQCKKELTLAEAMEADYQQEIEMLQSGEKVTFVELHSTIKSLEDDILRLTESSTIDLAQRNEAIEDLNNEIAKHSKSAVERKAKEAVQDTYDVERNSDLKREISVLKDSSIEIEAANDHCHTQNMNLETTCDGLRAAINEAKVELEHKSQELVTLKNVIYNLQEDSVIAKLELEAAKNQPLDANRKGNSLFAEVEDSRMKIQQTLQQMKKTYKEMRQDLDNLLRQLAVLRQHNVELSNQFNQPETCDEEFEKSINQYRIHMNILESKLEQYKQNISKEITFIGKNLASYAVDFINSTLKAKWSDDESVRSVLNEESKKKLATCIEIQKVNSQKRQWRRKAMQLKVQVEKLKSAIFRVQFSDSPIDDDDSVDESNSQPASNGKDDIENVKLDGIDIQKRSIDRRRNTIETQTHAEMDLKSNQTQYTTLTMITENDNVPDSNPAATEELEKKFLNLNSDVEYNRCNHKNKNVIEQKVIVGENQNINLVMPDVSQITVFKDECEVQSGIKLEESAFKNSLSDMTGIKTPQKEDQNELSVTNQKASSPKQHNQFSSLSTTKTKNSFLNLLETEFVEAERNSVVETKVKYQNESNSYKLSVSQPRSKQTFCSKPFRISTLANEMQWMLSIKDDNHKSTMDSEIKANEQNSVTLDKEQHRATNKFILNYVNSADNLRDQSNISNIQCSLPDKAEDQSTSNGFEYLNTQQNFQTEDNISVLDVKFADVTSGKKSEKKGSFSDKENAAPCVSSELSSIALTCDNQQHIMENISKESIDLVINLDSDEDDVVVISSDIERNQTSESDKSNGESESNKPTSWLSMFKTESKFHKEQEVDKENALPHNASHERTPNVSRCYFTQSERVSKIKPPIIPSSVSERKVLNRISNIPLPAKRNLN